MTVLTVYMEEDDEEQVIQVVTTVRTDPRQGLISKESPFGKAVLGAREGDRVTVTVSNDYSYVCEIRHIEKGADDGSAPILQYGKKITEVILRDLFCCKHGEGRNIHIIVVK